MTFRGLKLGANPEASWGKLGLYTAEINDVVYPGVDLGPFPMGKTRVHPDFGRTMTAVAT